MQHETEKINIASRITHHASRSRGFTLIEAIVATSVFAFIVSSILGVYIATFQLDRKSRAHRAVAQNARFISEFIGKEVRNGTIDYSSYCSTIWANHPLFF